MVMAQLLTYRLDIPQEGRMRIDVGTDGKKLELRLAETLAAAVGGEHGATVPQPSSTADRQPPAARSRQRAPPAHRFGSAS